MENTKVNTEDSKKINKNTINAIKEVCKLKLCKNKKTYNSFEEILEDMNIDNLSHL